MKKKYIRLSWEVYSNCVIKLVKQIKKGNLKFDGIYGIPKGGMVLATHLSYILDLPLLLYPTENTLVVDDISDTGKTLKNIKSKRIATLYYTKWTEVMPRYYCLEKYGIDEWIVFPWEGLYTS